MSSVAFTWLRADDQKPPDPPQKTLKVGPPKAKAKSKGKAKAKAKSANRSDSPEPGMMKEPSMLGAGELRLQKLVGDLKVQPGMMFRVVRLEGAQIILAPDDGSSTTVVSSTRSGSAKRGRSQQRRQR